jgi:hypothetical protein
LHAEIAYEQSLPESGAAWHSRLDRFNALMAARSSCGDWGTHWK